MWKLVGLRFPPLQFQKLKGHLNAGLSDLATERGRQLTTAPANQATDLTNGRAANWAPEVPSRAFSSSTDVPVLLLNQLFSRTRPDWWWPPWSPPCHPDDPIWVAGQGVLLLTLFRHCIVHDFLYRSCQGFRRYLRAVGKRVRITVFV